MTDVSPDEELHTLRYWLNRPLEQRRSLANIPRRFADATFKNYELSDRYGTVGAIEALQRGGGRRGRWVILVGKPGRGKTHLAAAALGQYVEDGGIGIFAGARYLSAMFAAARRNWGLLPEQYPSPHLITYLQTQWPLMVMDDLGAEHDDRQAVLGVENLMAHRYENELSLIITTQLNPAMLRERYGEDSISRMQEVGEVFVMEGDDYREKGGQKL